MKIAFSRTSFRRIAVSAVLISALFGVQGCIGIKTDHANLDITKAVGVNNCVPLVILGSGPAGLAAAIYGIRGMVKTVIIQGPLPGGLLTQTTEVENWPGEQS